MIEAMKLASLLGKAWRKDPEALTANEMLQAATAEGAVMFGLKAGQIKEVFSRSMFDRSQHPRFYPKLQFRLKSCIRRQRQLRGYRYL